MLRRDPRAALYVRGAHFHSWAVAEGDAELSEVTTIPGDGTVEEPHRVEVVALPALGSTALAVADGELPAWARVQQARLRELSDIAAARGDRA